MPVKTIPKVSEPELMSLEPDEKVLTEKARQDALLALPGVMFTDVEVRYYPYKEAAAHLTGYASQVTADDLETRAGEGYTENSGYGQGQILMNPLHLASLYTAFCNEGNVVKPYLLYKNEPQADIWIPGIFSDVTAAWVMEGMKKVVDDPEGTGYVAYREDIVLAGKTGTAEIKTSIEDTAGTEIGWFAVFTAEKDVENPVLLVSMVEDVKKLAGADMWSIRTRSCWMGI